MKITAIKAQVKNPDRVSIFVDGEYSFSLTTSQLLEQKLRVGFELDEQQLEVLKKVSNFGKAYERTLRYALLRPHSYQEMVLYCRRKQVEEEDARQILQKLCSRGYIDDEAFARSWVESRRINKPTSTKRLRLELLRKGVADEIIRKTLDEGSDDSEALRQMIAKKRRQVRYQDSQKLLAYLLRQGFQFDQIQRELHYPDDVDYSDV